MTIITVILLLMVRIYILQTFQKDGLQSTRLFKRIQKKSLRSREPSLSEEPTVEFHRSLSEAHLTEDNFYSLSEAPLSEEHFSKNNEPDEYLPFEILR